MKISKWFPTGKQKKAPIQECFRGGIKQSDTACKGTKPGNTRGSAHRATFPWGWLWAELNTRGIGKLRLKSLITCPVLRCFAL